MSCLLRLTRVLGYGRFEEAQGSIQVLGNTLSSEILLSLCEKLLSLLQ